MWRSCRNSHRLNFQLLLSCRHSRALHLSPEKWLECVFKTDHTTSKRIRYGFITVKSTTLIGLKSPRKNTTLSVIRSVEPRRTHIPV
ncbi:hypothetical protein TNCV_39081 [Trichonephila clavipes]|nr:hypothetical protein TNCV_39081 [Trichonephila clavipes]